MDVLFSLIQQQFKLVLVVGAANVFEKERPFPLFLTTWTAVAPDAVCTVLIFKSPRMRRR